MSKIKNKKIYLIAILLLLVTASYFILCKIASEQALYIFNKTMATQKVFKGSISVSAIEADIWGRVVFKDLTWIDMDGETIVQVPQGHFQIHPLDILTKRVTASTLQELELKDALFAIRFNSKMQPDIFKIADKQQVTNNEQFLEAVSQNIQAQNKEHAAQEKNLNLDDKKFKVKITLNNCTLTASYRDRYFALHEVNANLEFKSKDKIKLDLETGKFGGTIIGDGLAINGNIDLRPQIPLYDLQLALNNVLPSSMGIGDVKDLVTIIASITGDLPNPIIDGDLLFKELNIPGLHFTNVEGNLHYENALLKFTDVTGDVFGGKVEAFGDYNLNNRHYNIDAIGHELLAGIAARNGKLKCKVELEFKIRSKGDLKTAYTFGKFRSGKGSYYMIPFDSLSGEFSNQNKVLEFTNVIIKAPIGEISTDAFKIVDGKLRLGHIMLKKLETGQKILIK